MSGPSMPHTTQELKAAIDAGKTGDKIPEGFDPGLSTLGTDDEAAGTPNSPRQVEMAIKLETRGAAAPPPEQSSDTSQRGMPVLWIVAAAFIAALAVIVFAAVHGRV